MEQAEPMKRQSLNFEGPRQVVVRQEEIPALLPGEVLVKSILSAISPGTETLIYRDQAPKGLAADSTIAALEGEFNYPFKYGYSVVGEVIEASPEVEPDWLGRRVFAFNPHESHFSAQTKSLQRIPDSIPLEDAVFLPNMETAINFVMDGKPIIGERVAIFGQGTVGLLTKSLLSEFPLEELITFDNFDLRRSASLTAGANQSFHPQTLVDTIQRWSKNTAPGADLLYELSGSSKALNQAIRLAGFESRIIIGSWYGEKKSLIELGQEFHRNRIQLISSQVSTIAAEFGGRWDKTRRFDLAWKKIKTIRPSKFITHRFPLERAAVAYHLLDENPQDVIQVIFEYPE